MLSKSQTKEASYLEVGAAGRPTVLFLHGFPESKEAWTAHLAALGERYRGIAVDLPGFGESALDETKDAAGLLERMISTIVSMITKAREGGDGRVILVGHDWGGILAQATLGLQRAHVDQLILLNAPHPKRLLALMESSEEQRSRSRYIAYLQSEYFAAKERSSDFKRLRFSLFDEVSGVTAETQARYLSTWAQVGRLERMARVYDLLGPLASAPIGPITAPTRILWGELDHALTTENIQGLDEYFSDFRIETFPHLNHWTNHRILDELKGYFFV